MVTSANLVVPFSAFNTKCWDNTETVLTDADVPTIDTVDLQVPSGQTEIAVTNLCLNSITFGN